MTKEEFGKILQSMAKVNPEYKKIHQNYKKMYKNIKGIKLLNLLCRDIHNFADCQRVASEIGLWEEK